MSADALLRLEYVPIGRAVQWDENPKKHDLAALVDSIYRYGFQDPPKYDAALGALIFGNGRTAALRKAQAEGKEPPRGVMLDQGSGEWCIPVLFGNDLPSRDAARAFAVDHNNLTMAGSHTPEEMAQMWNAKGYANLMASLKSVDELPFTAWQDDNAKPADPGPQFDRAEELRQKWGVQSGDLWALGAHKLLCGDCTKREDVARLVGTERADCVFTDPPYGIEYQYKGYEDKKEGYFDFMKQAFWNLNLFLADNAAIYIKQYTHNLFGFYEILPKNWTYKNLIIWKNNSQAHPKTNYDNAFEIIYEFETGDLESVLFLEQGRPPFEADAEKRAIYWIGTERFDIPQKKGKMWNLWDDIKPLPGGFMRKSESLSEGSYKVHSCQMPCELPERALIFSTTKNAIVIDLFLGSGTTLIACERLGRRCRAIEISPAYVAVTLERWAQMTGKTPEIQERIS